MKVLPISGWIVAALLSGFIAGRYRPAGVDDSAGGRLLPGRATGALMESDRSPLTDVVDAALLKPVTIDLRNAPLRQLLDEFAAQTGVPFVLEEKVCAELGVDGGSLVTLNARNEAADAAFERIDFGDVAMSWYPAGDQVIVTTQEQAASRGVETRLYDVAPLLSVFQGRIERYGGLGGMPSFSCFSGPPTTQPIGEETADQLMQIIQDTVSSDSWKDNGGALGSLRSFSGYFLITNTRKNHRDIAALLALLQDCRAAGATTTQP